MVTPTLLLGLSVVMGMGCLGGGGHVVCYGFSETQLLPRGLQLASQLVLTAAPAVLGGTECRSYRASPGLPNAVG